MPLPLKNLLLPPALLALTLATPLDLAPSPASRPTTVAPPCAQWNQFGNWVSRRVPAVSDPSNPFFHTRLHSALNADLLLLAGMGMPNAAGERPTSDAYSEALRMVLGQLFPADLQFLAEANGFRSSFDLLAEQGLGALAGIVDFGTTTYSTESADYCATSHPITQGQHQGEFLVIARDKSNGRVIGVAIAGTEDEAKAKAEDMVAEAQRKRDGNGVMVTPDGCGDVRMPPGFGC